MHCDPSHESPEGDELDCLLGAADRDAAIDQSHAAIVAPSAPRAAVALRERLRGATVRRLAVRKRLRQIVRWTSLAACYLAGAATLYGWQHWATAGERERVATVANDEPRVEDGADQESNDKENLRTDSQLTMPPNAHVQPRVARAKPSRFAALRALGDQHLLDDRDPDRALRCYRMALRFATVEELAIASREGTWLLRTICNDPTMEKNHDHSKKS
jgi:hypothetical protein